jgi:hypothetical protein
VAGLYLLLAALPMASTREIFVENVVSTQFSIYQCPGMALLQFLCFPVILAVIWAMGRGVKGFAGLEPYLFTGASVVQVVSVFLLQRAVVDALHGTRTGAIPQSSVDRSGPAFWALLALTVAFLVYQGVLVVNSLAPEEHVYAPPLAQSPAELPVPPREVAYAFENAFEPLPEPVQRFEDWRSLHETGNVGDWTYVSSQNSEYN